MFVRVLNTPLILIIYLPWGRSSLPEGGLRIICSKIFNKFPGKKLSWRATYNLDWNDACWWMFSYEIFAYFQSIFLTWDVAFADYTRYFSYNIIISSLRKVNLMRVWIRFNFRVWKSISWFLICFRQLTLPRKDFTKSKKLSK